MIIPRVQKKKFRVDMAPLIDVVFLLLIFFMLTFAIQGKGMDLTLPPGSAGDSQTEKSLTVKVGNDNRVEINSRSVPLELFKDKLIEAVEAGQYKTIVIEAGSKARYELFARVLDEARQAGIKDFSIIRDME